MVSLSTLNKHGEVNSSKSFIVSSEQKGLSDLTLIKLLHMYFMEMS